MFEETYLKDIIERHHIEKTQELEDLVNILASAIGSLTNAPKIESTFRSVLRSKISGNTIRQYIEYLEDAFIIHKANRYNVKGRKYIGTPVKYYFEDVGLRNARLGFRQVEETHLMEILFTMNSGVVGTQWTWELWKNGRRMYREKQNENNWKLILSRTKAVRDIISSPLLPCRTNKSRNRKKMSLLQVKDSFKKIIVVKDVVNVTRDENGITTMSVYDFLLKDNSLEL